ncbi:MAG: hypothetical protein AAF413_01585 [Patescibacteria group bacterium]
MTREVVNEKELGTYSAYVLACGPQMCMQGLQRITYYSMFVADNNEKGLGQRKSEITGLAGSILEALDAWQQTPGESPELLASINKIANQRIEQKNLRQKPPHKNLDSLEKYMEKSRSISHLVDLLELLSVTICLVHATYGQADPQTYARESDIFDIREATTVVLHLARNSPLVYVAPNPQVTGDGNVLSG